jgi:hypothetical protein
MALGEVLFEQFAAHARGDWQRANSLLSPLNKLATAVASMHWTLVQFDEPLLITSDQPVVGAPILGVGERREIEAMPSTGWADTIEIRFPLTPRLALLASWHPGVECESVVPGTWEQAVNFNAAVRAQAHARWFHDPTRMPPFPPAVLWPPATEFPALSPRLLPGYGSVAALNSPLRHWVLAEVQRLIERQDETLMCVARPAFKAEAA